MDQLKFLNEPIRVRNPDKIGDRIPDDDAWDQGYKAAEGDTDAARSELLEIVTSFKRDDMEDVRRRLMALGNILNVTNIWIPSR